MPGAPLPKILVVDDEPEIPFAIGMALEDIATVKVVVRVKKLSKPLGPAAFPW